MSLWPHKITWRAPDLFAAFFDRVILSQDKLCEKQLLHLAVIKIEATTTHTLCFCYQDTDVPVHKYVDLVS